MSTTVTKAHTKKQQITKICNNYNNKHNMNTDPELKTIKTNKKTISNMMFPSETSKSTRNIKMISLWNVPNRTCVYILSMLWI